MKPLVFCILDGVGIANVSAHNAVTMARMPFYRELLARYPNMQLDASGPAVGLPSGTMGNSEVGHITIGAGRIVNQFLRRFDVENWDTNKPLADFLSKVNGTVHIVGMMSDGRVHSDICEIIFMARHIVAAGKKVLFHFIADGRDTTPKSAQKYIDMIRVVLPSAEFATLTGRYYAMDRNNNLERTEKAFDAIARGQGEFSADSIDDALAAAYTRGETDEFIKPVIIGHPSPVVNGDGILFCNYRADRARQILRSLITTGVRILAFSQYGEGLNEIVPALLPDIPVENTLGDVLAANGKTQLRIAETEKYNHVTYFFDAERNIDFAGEEKVLIPSPAVATFDLKPEMSAREITDALMPRLSLFDVIILNYANGDMVGHTGNIDAAVNAMETLDAQLARFIPRVLDLGGTVLITADHGNVEQMRDNTGIWTAHTTNKVPFIVVNDSHRSIKSIGGLSDIAPTILELLDISQPTEMTGKSLIPAQFVRFKISL